MLSSALFAILITKTTMIIVTLVDPVTITANVTLVSMAIIIKLIEMGLATLLERFNSNFLSEFQKYFNTLFMGVFVFISWR